MNRRGHCAPITVGRQALFCRSRAADDGRPSDPPTRLPARWTIASDGFAEPRRPSRPSSSMRMPRNRRQHLKMHSILSWRRQDPSIERATRSASCRAFVWSEPASGACSPKSRRASSGRTLPLAHHRRLMTTKPPNGTDRHLPTPRMSLRCRKRRLRGSRALRNDPGGIGIQQYA
jgi:hypothetical protein